MGFKKGAIVVNFPCKLDYVCITQEILTLLSERVSRRGLRGEGPWGLGLNEMGK